MWIQGKEYYSVSQWVGILNRDYEKWVLRLMHVIYMCYLIILA